jgi:hypothetical protein
VYVAGERLDNIDGGRGTSCKPIKPTKSKSGHKRCRVAALSGRDRRVRESRGWFATATFPIQRATRKNTTPSMREYAGR